MFFLLRQLAHGIQEIYLHGDAGHRLVSRVRDGAVDVAHRGTDEIFGGGHFEIGELELRDIRRGRHDFFRRLAQEEGRGERESDDNRDGDDDDQAAGVAFLGDRGLLAEAVHGGIVGR